MLKKVVKVLNVGRFNHLVARGEVTFRQLTLIYGLNGHGKTTLTGIFRSLATGDRAYVDERATLGVNSAPACEILLDTGSAKFSNGTWSATAPELEIFDTTFVNDNVFTGEHVGADHRKNLYEVVVGSAAVALVRDVDQIDAEARKKAAEISDTEKELSALIQAPFPLKSFLELRAEPGVTERIRDCTSRLSAVRKQTEILARPQLEWFRPTLVPVSLISVLGKSVQEVSAEAERRVRAHLQKLDHRAEGWLRQGLAYVSDELCPFCGQNMERASVDIVGAYREFFSNVYNEHLVELERANILLEQTLGDDALQALHRQISSNTGRISGWSDLVDLSKSVYDPDVLDLAWKHLRELLRQRLREKTANPARALIEDARLTAAMQDFTAHMTALTQHNACIASANQVIGEIKKQAAATKAEVLEEELRRLRNIEIRYAPETIVLVEKLGDARVKKKQLDEAKTKKKQNLSTVSESVLEKYQASINKLLSNFGANFSIINARPVFPGGKASSTYQLQLNGTALDIGDANTPRGKPCFRTALSTGDKSTLALAFFLARLEHDDISTKCVIIDDPLSSFDSFRTACTQHQIAAIAQKARQTVVLSHDAFFLKGVLDASQQVEAKCLQVIRAGGTHLLREWSPSEYFLKQKHSEYFLLRSFLANGPPENGDLTSIARAMRPYIEGHLRHCFPDAFGDGEWLGDFIAKVRDAKPASPLAAFAGRLLELEQINDYCKGFHHAGLLLVAPPTDTELRAWVERALGFAQT